MALSTKSKQKKIAKKASKRKAKLKEKNSAATLSPKEKMDQKMSQAITAPIHQCHIPENLFEEGIGNLIMTRTLSETRVGMAVFLIDVWAKGVVECYYDEMSLITFEQQMQEVNRRISPMKQVEPAYFAKLVQGAHEFATSHEFAAHAYYATVKKIFSDVDVMSCDANFEFGKEGLPYVVKRGCHDANCGHDH